MKQLEVSKPIVVQQPGAPGLRSCRWGFSVIALQNPTIQIKHQQSGKQFKKVLDKVA
jgi:hypothetical protein